MFSSRSSTRLAVLTPILVILSIFFYNEYLIYFHVLFQCEFPALNSTAADSGGKPINVMLLADTHLLGSRNGHWFDKLRREWQQYRAYQTANLLLRPNYIVILGDLTDEGKWCGDKEWEYYVKRTNELFSVDENLTKLFILAGNHDVGFHYSLHDHLLQRFNRSFTKQFVDFYQLDENSVSFVLINSMALENDECKFCKRAQAQIQALNLTLKCIKENTCDESRDDVKSGKKYTKPIVFTHFPLYRASDQICPPDIDSEPAEKWSEFEPKYDCLSRDATKQVVDLLNPRLVFSGHTHFSCFNKLHGIPEHTIASFSWRNIKTPSMLLLTVNDESHMVNKCFLPSELTVFKLYTALGLFVFLYLIYFIRISKLFSFSFLRRRVKSN